jgi:hypothetical protein
MYQWTSGNQTGSGDTFTLSSAANGATVKCVLISSAGCANPDSAFSNILTISTQSPSPVTTSISTADTNVCSGDSATFFSAVTNGGNNPVYNWYVNGSAQGTGPSFAISNVQSTATVYCVVSANGSCITGSPDTSNSINIHAQTSLQASVSISASRTIVCSGTLVTFTATAVNGGSSPAYAWSLNGSQVGADSAIYTTSALQNGSAVLCKLTSSASCVSNPTVASNTVNVQVNPLPVADAGIDAHINSLSTDTLGGHPSASGGTSPYGYLWSPATGLSFTSISNPVVSGLTGNAAYTLKVTDAKGCTAYDTVQVYSFPCSIQTPTVQLSFCDLEAQYIAAVNYQWYLQGSAIPGASARLYTASQTGSFNVWVTDSAGCTAQSTGVSVSYPACLTTEITIVSESPEFEIYPNPAGNTLTISFSNSISGIGHIEIYDVFGQLVYRSGNTDIGAGNSSEIKINMLSSGSYLIRVTDADNRFAARRFIKM